MATMRPAAAALLASALCATARALKTNMLLPLYAYPAPGAWDHVYRAIEDNPTLEFQVVINPSSGPGPSSRVGYDDNWANATATINSYDNARAFGYVHLLDGEAPAAAVEANITTWRAWGGHDGAGAGAGANASADTSVHGIFFDETPDDDAAYMRGLVGAARDALGADCRVVFNPGKAVLDDEYFALADHVIVSEVTAATYRAASASAPRTNVAPGHAARASILVYDFAAGGGGSGGGPAAEELRAWLGGMVAAGIGSVNVVDYGWDASNTGDGPADVGTVAAMLVEARASAGRGGGLLAVFLVALSLVLAIC